MTSPFPYNYHGHSVFCDGSHSLEDYLIAAIKKGYLSYGFSSHAPIPGGSVWNMKAEDLDPYLREINRLKIKYKDKIEIYSSLEIDYIDAVQGPSRYADLLDYTIGSIHFIGHGPMKELFEMDGPYPHFLKGLERHYQMQIREAVEHYYELTLKMIQSDPPDVLGHIDKIVSHAMRFEEGINKTAWYLKMLHKIAQELSKTNIIIEINTKGLQLSHLPTSYPHLEFLNILNQYPQRFQMNADVHKTSQLDLGYAETLRNIKCIGIKELWVRERNQWISKSI